MSRKEKKEMQKQEQELKESQLNINEEVELLVEIQDIRDELHIIKMVLDDQWSVLTVQDSEGDRKTKEFERNALHTTFPDVDGKPVDYYVNVNRKTIERMISRARDVYNAVWV